MTAREDFDARRRELLARVSAATGQAWAVVSVERTADEQARLWAIGRDLRGGRWVETGRVVTYARPGQSPHQCGLAVDMVPRALLADRLWAPDHELWTAYGWWVRKVGLTWGGDWQGRKRDLPHAELPGWRARLRAEGWA